MDNFQVLFDNFDLNSIGYIDFSRRYPNEEAKINIISHDLLRRPGAVVTSVRHGVKKISLEGYILAPSRIAYEEAFDELKFRTSAAQRPLVISQAGSNRVYVATKESIIEEHIEAGKSKISIVFTCANPYGKSEVLTTSSEVLTTTPSNISVLYAGTAEARPVFTIIFNSLSGGTNKYVGIGNATTGQQIQTSRNWVAGDVVRFDTDLKRVFVNTVLTNYNGVFPSFSPYSESSYYYDNLTSRNITIEVSYAKQYL
jgi:hypothetical protein